MNEQEYFMKVNMLGQEAQKIEEQIQIIDQQTAELMAVKASIKELSNAKGKSEVLANLGKGIFVKADVNEKQLLVNVGKDIIVKKTPKETIAIIDDQIGKMNAGKEQFIERIQSLQEEMQNVLLEVQKGQAHKHDENCKHDCECENEDCECEEPCDECECEKKGKK